jgi:hypothetical protein
MSTRLIFVYAVDGGLVSSVFNFAHKTLSPSTYRCNMCALTYGSFGAKKEWSSFIGTLPFPTTFLHRDELTELHPNIKEPLPAVLVEGEGELKVLVDAAAIGGCKSLDQLMKTIRDHVDALTAPGRSAGDVGPRA